MEAYSEYVLASLNKHILLWVLTLIFLCIVFVEPMLSVPSLPLQRQTWMTTSRLTARLHPPLPQLNTLHTMASSHSTQLKLPRLPSMTRLHHAVPHSPLTAAFITSLAATRRTPCCCLSRPPPLSLTQRAATPLTFMSSTRQYGSPQLRHTCATFLSVMTSRPHLVQTVPTRCHAHCLHQQGQEAQRVGEM